MRRRWQDRQPASMFRAGELRWLFSGTLLLVLLYLLITRWGGPAARPQPPNDVAPVATKAERTVPSSTRQAPATAQAPKPQDDRHTPLDEDRSADLDPEEMEVAKEEFQAISDGTLTIGREEMEAYYRLLTWVESQSFAELQRRARKGLWFTDLHDHPGQRRGELIVLDLDVVRVKDLGAKNRHEVHLWEASGVTDESRPWLYDLVVVDFPKGMPTGPNMRERAKFVGYFLKLQGYLPHDARPGQRPEKAPLLIGRLVWEPVTVPQADQTLEWVLGTILLAVVGALLIGRLLWRLQGGKRNRTGAPAETTVRQGGEANPVDAWLHRVEKSEPEDPADEPES